MLFPGDSSRRFFPAILPAILLDSLGAKSGLRERGAE
jgi:hypothetical protein